MNIKKTIKPVDLFILLCLTISAGFKKTFPYQKLRITILTIIMIDLKYYSQQL